jgi:hypothetical protein
MNVFHLWAEHWRRHDKLRFALPSSPQSMEMIVKTAFKLRSGVVCPEGAPNL